MHAHFFFFLMRRAQKRGPIFEPFFCCFLDFFLALLELTVDQAALVKWEPRARARGPDSGTAESAKAHHPAMNRRVKKGPPPPGTNPTATQANSLSPLSLPRQCEAGSEKQSRRALLKPTTSTHHPSPGEPSSWTLLRNTQTLCGPGSARLLASSLLERGR